MEKQRIKVSSIGFFNIAKGIGLLFVILGHSIIIFQEADSAVFYSWYGRMFRSFCAGIMAMFFLISGYSFYSRKFKKCIQTQWKLLIKPYWITAGLIVCAKVALAVLKHRSIWKSCGQYVIAFLLTVNKGWKDTVLGVQVDNISLFWFFWALFGGWVLYNSISRIKSENVQMLLAAVCMLAGWSMTLFSRVWIFVIPNMFVTVGFLCVGHKMKKTGFLEKERLSVWEGLILIIPSLITLVFGEAEMNTMVWKLGPLDLLGCTCLGILFCRMTVLLKMRGSQGVLLKSLDKIGFNTMTLLCIHGFEEKIFPWYKLSAVFQNSKLVAVLVCFVIRCCLIYILFQVVHFANRKIKQQKKKKKRRDRI